MTWEYTPEFGQEICDLLIDGKSMNQIGQMDEYPSRHTMLRWLRDNEDFATRCARARRIQGELAVDQHNEIIEEVKAGKLPVDVARVVLSGLEWRAKKLEPRKYGDSLKHTGDKDDPVVVKDETVTGKLLSMLSEDQLKALEGNADS